jgi:hypothetical protein
MHIIPQHCSLDGVVEINQSLEGVTLQSLTPGSTIYARTRHNDYRIFLLDPESGRALVEGGRFFVEPTEATVVGSTFGGCMLKMGWIGIGLRLEILLNGQPIITSPVQALQVERETIVPPAVSLAAVSAEQQSQPLC